MTPKLSLTGQMAAQAQFVVDNLQQTDYQHPEKVDVDRGIYDLDCNGFVSLVMQRAAPAHYSLIPKEMNQPRPRAFEYYVFFSSLTPESTGGWHRINLLRDARRGDILAWRFPTVEKGQDTGHVVVVAETPVIDAAGIFSVRVYDSAAHPHFEDTRGMDVGEFKTGVGSGVIKFKVDGAGRPTSFQFSPSSQFKTLPIAIGRIEPLPV